MILSRRKPERSVFLLLTIGVILPRGLVAQKAEERHPLLRRGLAQDSDPPSVEITYPRDGSEFGVDETVKVKAKVNGIGDVATRLWIDGDTWIKGDSPFEFDVVGLKVGTYELFVRARDKNDRASFVNSDPINIRINKASAPVNLDVDSTPSPHPSSNSNPNSASDARDDIDLDIAQITFGEGTKHHFFGYIGHCRTIPWSGDNRYILGLETEFIDRMPAPNGDAAKIFVVDTKDSNRILYLDKTNAWNHQQGTMFYWNPNVYWNPHAAKTQFFFNDRDLSSGQVFTVLFDVEKRERIWEYRFANTPIANGGVSWNGGFYAAINYGRLARLRSVTGYPGALDWSSNDTSPDSDGIFKVDIGTGRKKLLVSFRQLEDEIQKSSPGMNHTGLFINHSLISRDSTRIYFFVRANWDVLEDGYKRIDIPFTINVDGSGLKMHRRHIGGHPEWASGSLMIGQAVERVKGKKIKRQVYYDVETSKVVGHLGDRKIFPRPDGDVALSLDGKLFVNGYSPDGKANVYTIYRLSDGAYARSEGVDKGNYSGNIRIDAAPRWDRRGSAILIPGIAKDGTRQMFVMNVTYN